MDTREKILLVDDSLLDLRIHAGTLAKHGYLVVTAASDEEALSLAEADPPDLFLIAARTKHLDGFGLCERIKQDQRFFNTPVVFITQSGSAREIDRSFSAGGVDYIKKPCHLSEFLARVRTHIRLYRLLREVEALKEEAIDLNPLTHLPGNNTIVARVENSVKENLDDCIIHVDLDNFKSYNDAFGFSAGDDVLRFSADLLQTVLQAVCGDEGFLGHVGGDDFVLIVSNSQAQEVGREIVTRFDSGILDFYSEDDRKRGYIKSVDRRGQRVKVPFISISMGGVILGKRSFTRSVEVFSACAEVKKAAKAVPGSNLFLDRRNGERRDKSRRGAGVEYGLLHERVIR